jgi:hypothetical protein
VKSACPSCDEQAIEALRAPRRRLSSPPVRRASAMPGMVVLGHFTGGSDIAPVQANALGRGRFSASQAALRLPSSLSPSPSHTRALPF